MSASFRSVFSFNGRINRTQFLVRFVGLTTITLVFFRLDKDPFVTDDPFRGIAEATAIFMLTWCFWANSAKRWHDCDRSSLYVFLNVIPGVGVILNLLLNLCVAGTPGPNRFGVRPNFRS
jgi:uncharacterized membrane protein YhaH (DUF805 family)